jgi:hypothetical protein
VVPYDPWRIARQLWGVVSSNEDRGQASPSAIRARLAEWRERETSTMARYGRSVETC